MTTKTPHDTDLRWRTKRNTKRYFRRIPRTGRPGMRSDHLVYSFTSPGGDAFFAVLDPYYLHRSQCTSLMGLGGHIDPTQFTWLADQVAQTKATHKFLFIHTPYYYVSGSDPDEPSAANDTLRSSGLSWITTGLTSMLAGIRISIPGRPLTAASFPTHSHPAAPYNGRTMSFSFSTAPAAPALPPAPSIRTSKPPGTCTMTPKPITSVWWISTAAR